MGGVRIAWFSPFPPVKTGIAGRSAELVDVLRGRGYTIDAYTEANAHDFPWRRRLEQYDLPVYQFGNSSHHDYEWPYTLRYPGLVVLHDTRLHHARAALLLREKRVEDYRAEFRWTEPDISPDAAEIAIAGFDSPLYYDWPFVRALVGGSRVTAVHGEGARQELIDRLHSTPDSANRILSLRLGEGVLVSPGREARARREVRAKYGIAPDAVLFGCFGGLTPEKRIPQIIAAFRALEPYAPNARLLLAGAAATHFDVPAEIGRGIREAEGGGPHDVRGTDAVTVTGYLETDDDLTDHIAACDVTLNLRWPTARETSGPWLRALAAGKATVITDLVHLADVLSFDPRTWCVRELGVFRPPTCDLLPQASPDLRPRTSDLRPVCVAVDILDEDHSLRLALRRLATDADLRALLGRAAREYWTREHSVEVMADDYEGVMRVALAREAGEGGGPPHLRSDGDIKLRELLAPFRIQDPF
jgi:glycosyltransferase involved in cell wall biosynthesis